jgi:hypothetical protein
MASSSFETRVAQVDQRIREINPEIAGELRRDDTRENTVTWERNGAWATLTLHDDARLELSLHPAQDVPDILEIRIDDADVVNMIAVPVANHLK